MKIFVRKLGENMFQIQSYINKITTMGNHSLRLQVDLEKELSPEENAKVFALYNKLGWFIFKEAEIKEQDLVDIPEEALEFKDQKSPSQIFRNRMYVYYKDKHGNDKGFDDWRKTEMLRLGQWYLDKMQD